MFWKKDILPLIKTKQKKKNKKEKIRKNKETGFPGRIDLRVEN